MCSSLLHAVASRSSSASSRHLIFFVRLARKAPPPILRLALLTLEAPRSWLGTVRSILKAVWCRLGAESALPDPEVSLFEWFQAAHFVDKPCLKLWIRTAMACFPFGGTQVQAGPQLAAEQVCYECGKVFGSLAALRAHCHNKHGYVNPCVARVCTTYCVACGVEFHTSARLVTHLRRSGGDSACAMYYSSEVPLLEPDERVEQAAAERQCQRGLSVKTLHLPPVPRFGD